MLPLINTVLLLSSGVTVTYAHHLLLQPQSVSKRGARFSSLCKFTKNDEDAAKKKPKNRVNMISYWLLVTVGFGIVFTAVQLFEYKHAAFSIFDGIYGSIFYLLTGFHGVHVLIGTVFLLVCFFRVRAGHFTALHHLGFETAI